MNEMKAKVVLDMVLFDEVEEDGWGEACKSFSFDTACEARNWLKAITEPLVTLVEVGAIQSFETQLIVWREEI